MHSIVSLLKNWTLPVAIILGTALYLVFAFVPQLEDAAVTFGEVIAVIFPMSVFATLFITFSKVDFHLMGLRRWHIVVVLLQLMLVGFVTLLILLYTEYVDPERKSFFCVALALLTCVIAPCASASPVVTAKLGGNLTAMTSFVLLSSIVTAVAIPAVFPLVSPSPGFSFIATFFTALLSGWERTTKFAHSSVFTTILLHRPTLHSTAGLSHWQ